ncbi:ABC transporter ATP-binding protein [Peribacillus huizhouensis]|uniref:ABC-2 type transport system ATP-binding protein n=1 Tax=Peribacillus huizhouensis TaxID=1501239 RepID=A0ABR6CKG9_9BACI|nr:ABC transporter ATP-binding protein [Peribacillus huizhouensis]MBA9025549.1 ABC-2 type transport system ATP-binding protein [Peribacillus huizhouensis]
MIVVSLNNVSKKIGSKTIIDNLSFDVHAGEIFGFLGPNGAGKTTTIRMLVGLMKITSGDIFIDGHSVKSNYEEAIAKVGAIVENPEMYKFMSGYDNLKHYARMTKGVTMERIDEVAELVGLQNRMKEKVKTYSLGMRQRLGIAQALLHRPKVLILDEPTNGLDPAGIREIRDYLKRLARVEDMAVVVSSHLLSEMEMMCDRIGIIQNGRMVDVQLVNDMVNDGNISYLISAKPVDQAFNLLQNAFEGVEVKVTKQLLHVEGASIDVPKLVKRLVENNCDIYEVKQINQSLEEKFLEITSEKGGIA